MKNTKKYLFAFAAILLLSCLILGMSAFASGELPVMDEADSTYIEFVYGNKGSTGIIFPKGTRFSNIKSSSSAITARAKSYGKTEDYLQITGTKACKGTVTFKASYHDETVNYKIKVTFIKYKNPFKTIKIGNKDYTSQFNKKNDAIYLRKKTSGKLIVTPAKGFKINAIEIFDPNTGRSLGRVKSGSKITLKNGQNLSVSFTINSVKDWGFGFDALVCM